MGRGKKRRRWAFKVCIHSRSLFAVCSAGRKRNAKELEVWGPVLLCYSITVTLAGPPHCSGWFPQPGERKSCLAAAAKNNSVSRSTGPMHTGIPWGLRLPHCCRLPYRTLSLCVCPYKCKDDAKDPAMDAVRNNTLEVMLAWDRIN